MTVQRLAGGLARPGLGVVLARVALVLSKSRRATRSTSELDPSAMPDWQLRDLGFKDGRATGALLRQEANLR